MDVRGKTVLITGGRRVGSELALLLAERGASLVMTYHQSREIIEGTIARVEALGARGLAVKADLTRAGQADQAVERAVAAFGHLDVLVNMASIYRKTPFDELTPSDYDDLMAANLAAPYHSAVYAARAMRKNSVDNGMKGKIVNVGDWASERPGRGFLPYITAKGALTTLTMALANELAPHILVNMIQPATIEPPPWLSEVELAETVAETPLARIGAPADVNRLILYLLEGTDYATGACFRVDGGRFLGNANGRD
jgi:pteridine reductase